MKIRSVLFLVALVALVAVMLPFLGQNQGSISQPAASVELNPGILKSFVARGSDKIVVLQWSTSGESMVNQYSLYRGFAPVGKFSLISEIPTHRTKSQSSDYTYVDEWVINGVTYYYKIAYKADNYAESVHPMLVSATPTDAKGDVPPESLKQYQLFTSSANLMTAPTTVDFYVRNSGMVRMIIYDLDGNEIKTLVSRDFYPGMYTLDLTHQDVDAGVYFLKMIGENGFSTIEKVLVVK